MTTYTCHNAACPNVGIPEDRTLAWTDVPEESRAYKGQQWHAPPVCDLCGEKMEFTPLQMAHDLATGGTGLDVQLGDTTHRFSSFHEMRRFSEDSIKRARSGEGTPTVFRALEQNRGNMSKNTLAGSEFETNKQIPLDRRTGRGKRLKVTGGVAPPPASAE